MENPALRELWELSGSHWTLPIIAEVHGDTALVTVPDIPYLKQQRAVLENALSQLATGGTETERAIPTPILLEHARKSLQPDAESVVAWNRMPSPTVNLPNDEGVDEFVADWLISTGFGISKTSATTIYVSLVTHMLHWLVNRRRPVNLMFGRIEPFQFRKNWKEIILGKAWVKTKSGKLEDGSVYVENHLPTPADLCRSEMLAYDKGVCRWTVEFTPTAWFHKHSEQVEFNRRKRLGGKAYLVSVCRTIMSQAERAIQTYRKFLHEQTTKIISLPEFDVGGSGYFGKVTAQSTEKVHRAVRAFVLPADVADSLASSPPGDETKEDYSLP